LSATGFQVTFDAADPAALAKFWAQVLGYVRQSPPPGFDDWPSFLKTLGYAEEEMDKADAIVDPDGKGPRVFFQKVPEGKTAKNRVHLDVNVGAGLDGAARRDAVRKRADEVIALGAVEQREDTEHGEYWIVLTDIEGNEFCLQ
jgi:hypothetical protein